MSTAERVGRTCGATAAQNQLNPVKHSELLELEAALADSACRAGVQWIQHRH
jgi:hypothetical protein